LTMSFYTILNSHYFFFLFLLFLLTILSIALF
jgi:hypothetical protein